jgi:ABC-type oligopeptide transport system substrate-binding subunit
MTSERPGDNFVLATALSSDTFYNASSVQLEEIALVPVANSTTSINLYKAGECDWVRDLPHVREADRHLCGILRQLS